VFGNLQRVRGEIHDLRGDADLLIVDPSKQTRDLNCAGGEGREGEGGEEEAKVVKALSAGGGEGTGVDSLNRSG
jgi:hypothetical protein